MNTTYLVLACAFTFTMIGLFAGIMAGIAIEHKHLNKREMSFDEYLKIHSIEAEMAKDGWKL